MKSSGGLACRAESRPISARQAECAGSNSGRLAERSLDELSQVRTAENPVGFPQQDLLALFLAQQIRAKNEPELQTSRRAVMAVDQNVCPQELAVLRLTAEYRDDAWRAGINVVQVRLVQVDFLDALPHGQELLRGVSVICAHWSIAKQPGQYTAARRASAVGSTSVGGGATCGTAT